MFKQGKGNNKGRIRNNKHKQKPNNKPTNNLNNNPNQNVAKPLENKTPSPNNNKHNLNQKNNKCLMIFFQNIGKTKNSQNNDILVSKRMILIFSSTVKRVR